MASVGGFEAGGFLQGLVSSSTTGQGGNEMMLLEKQGLCSQQQRQAEARCGSLPPSSLPRPKRHHKNPGSGKDRKLGEYGRLSDGEGNNSRKVSANSSTDTTDNKTRNSPVRSVIPLPPRKLGEYGRLSDGDTRKASNSSTEEKPRESPVRNMPTPPRKLGEYGRLSTDSGRKTPADSGSDTTGDNLSLNTRSSPARKYAEFVRFDDPRKQSEGKSVVLGEFDGRKLSTSSEKTRDSPTRSLLPPPRKLSDYGCFESPPPLSPQSKESKLRLLPPGSFKGRRGSLNQPPSQKPPNEPAVRSLPTPNKYRIQF